MLRQLTNCLCCGSFHLECVLDLGEQPLANSYPAGMVALPRFPLALNYCVKCSHLQLTHSVDRSAIFTDYPYVSGTTQTLRDDFAAFALQVTQKHGVGTVLDIACNDGSQLDAFKALGWKTIGIDPAKNLYELSSKNHEVYCDFLGEHHSTLKADIIVAQNVLAHTDNPLNFLQICQQIAPTIYVQTSQANMVNNGEFDTMYHEHISFFSERSMAVLADRAGLVLRSISKRSIHGTSFLFELSSDALITRETIAQFADKATATLADLSTLIKAESASGRKVIGYGAAAKGMTVLNAIDAQLDYIVDDNPLKHGLYSPGQLIPILDPDQLCNEQEPFTIIVLAWNFYDEVKQKVLNRVSTDVKFVRYFPTMAIE
jgi:2-polyprenyl-3-methyl-5-hydroxy-6-metoxy-1,4-benzoquinol methylase